MSKCLPPHFLQLHFLMNGEFIQWQFQVLHISVICNDELFILYSILTNLLHFITNLCIAVIVNDIWEFWVWDKTLGRRQECIQLYKLSNISYLVFVIYVCKQNKTSLTSLICPVRKIAILSSATSHSKNSNLSQE